MTPTDLINTLVKTKAAVVAFSSQGFFYLRIKEPNVPVKIHRLRLVDQDGKPTLVPFDPKSLRVSDRRALSKNAWREGLKITDIATLFGISTASATTDVNHNP